MEDAGTKVIRLPACSPDLNGYAERWIRSLRQECLDWIIILNEAHLRWVLGEYVRYYNQRRPHQSLQHLPPEGAWDACIPRGVESWPARCWAASSATTAASPPTEFAVHATDPASPRA